MTTGISLQVAKIGGRYKAVQISSGLNNVSYLHTLPTHRKDITIFSIYSSIIVVVLVVAAVVVVVDVVVVVVAAVAVVVILLLLLLSLLLLRLSRVIKSVSTGQAPVILEWKNTPRKNTKQTKGGKSYIIAEAVHASTKKYEHMRSEVSLRTSQAHTGTYVSIFASETGYTACHLRNPINAHVHAQIQGEKRN